MSVGLRWRGYPSVVAIRLVLADNTYLVREGVRRLLETLPEFEVAAVGADLESLLAAVGSNGRRSTRACCPS